MTILVIPSGITRSLAVTSLSLSAIRTPLTMANGEAALTISSHGVPTKASIPISVIVSGITTSLRLVQPANAQYIISVTLSGITTLSKALHSANADSTITSTPSSMITSLRFGNSPKSIISLYVEGNTMLSAFLR